VTISMNQDLTGVSEMKLIIKIKETVDEIREMTAAESAMDAISRSSERFEDSYRFAMKAELDKVGFVHRLDGQNYRVTGKFRNALFQHETIRDATKQEQFAYYSMQKEAVCKEGGCIICSDCMCSECNNYSVICSVYHESCIAKEILEGKEIVLELPRV